ncbi:MAG TPA: c-type cytochrome [Verrucomicrobia bacterium]|nr:c-type cytochrome [Verrucomicrobiales bacterium]HIL53936.1 c-type cytochrome [Verrucomicrobiota bacterium]
MQIRLLIALASVSQAPAELVPVNDLGLRIAPGFEITHYADSIIAPDVYSMTLDPSGSVVISSRGYIKRLTDKDGDGVADTETILIKSSAGAMGMLFLDERTLLTTEGGYFNRYIDKNGDGKFDSKPFRIGKFGGGEHGIHAIRKDSQGRIYLIGGNDSKFAGHQDMKGYSQLEGGALIRYSSNLSDSTLLCHGLRNPYDFDFNSEGQIFTYDSDCEREFFLPWYSPTRLYRLEDGAHHGWRLSGWKRGWKRPDYYYDSVKPVVNIGRGSPTGVAVYRHTAFPEHYHDAVFYCDWTFGKVYVTQATGLIEEVGFPVTDTFLESSGTNGFAPSDIEVGSDGSIFLSVGGRGTTGSVYHIKHKDPRPEAEPIRMGKVIFKGFQKGSEKLNSGLKSEEAMIVARHLDSTLLHAPIEDRMRSLRLLMKALGDWNLKSPSKESFTGYELSTDEIFNKEHNDLLVMARNSSRALLHSLNLDERRESARLIAMLRDSHPISSSRILSFITKDSRPEEDFHFLACLARLSSSLDSDSAKQISESILHLDSKVQGKQVRSKQTYIDRLNEVIAGLAERGSIFEHMCKSPFLARPNHVGIAAAFPEPFRSRAAEVFFLAALKESKNGWRADLITLISALDLTRSVPLFRVLAENPSLRAAAVIQLSKEPAEKDRHLFLAALNYSDQSAVSSSIEALAVLGPRAEPEELIALFGVSDMRLSLPLISRLAGKKLEDRSEATKWLAKNYPLISSSFRTDNPSSKVNWNALLSDVDWTIGNLKKGEKIFAERACVSCHLSANALGPDLAGISKRLSPIDLFRSIIAPNANVPPAYRATVFTMNDGAKHIGRIAFNSADGVIVRTGSGRTVRLNEPDIIEQKDWSNSLMPEGLLLGLGAGQLADLYAYLKTL